MNTSAPLSASSWLHELQDRLADLKDQHLLRVRRTVAPAGGPLLQVDGQPMLAFCSNDYLGLASHPALAAAASEAAHAYGLGSGGSPLVSGHSTANALLEHDLARFVGLPRALYFYAGYATNVGIVPALVGAGDALFSDALNHACLIDGARLSRATIHRYPHSDLAALEAALASSQARRKLVVTDAVFSMDGDVADVPALLALCERYDALLLMDDAHGFGVLGGPEGQEGRGTLAHYGLTGDNASPRILYMATLGKAAGVAGAFVAGSDALVEWLLQKTRSYIFATAAPALLAKSLQASLQVMQAETWRYNHLQQLIARLRAGLAPLLQRTPWQLLPSSTPIQPLVIGSNAAALDAMESLRSRGLWVPAIRPPTVPEGTARLRIALSAAHTLLDIDRLVQALAEHAASLGAEQQH